MADAQTQAENTATLDSLYSQHDYRVDIDVVYPFNTLATTQVTNLLLRNTGDTANRIDVRGDGNYIEIKNDSVVGYLPFFGERRLSAGAYGGANASIHFEEPLRAYKKEMILDRGKLLLTFKAEQKGSDNENYEIQINIYPNKQVSVDVSPVYKTFIRYDGHLDSTEKTE